MKTVVYRRHGEPSEVLAFENASNVLQPGPDEVLVRVTTRMVHPIDELLVRGIVPMPIPPSGATPGGDGVGIVELTGSNIDPASGVIPGARVALLPPIHGTWAERLVAPASSVIPVPAEVSNEVACQIILNGITAIMLLRAAPAIDGDAPVLITAAASSVGRNLLALCHHRKVNVVAAVRSEESAAMLAESFKGLAVVNTETAGWADAVTAAYGKSPSTIIDPVGGSLTAQLLNLLADRGTLLTYGGLDHRPSTISTTMLAAREITIRGVSSWSWTAQNSPEQRAADINELFELARLFRENFAGYQTFSLADALPALAASRTTPRRGAVLLTSAA